MALFFIQFLLLPFARGQLIFLKEGMLFLVSIFFFYSCPPIYARPDGRHFFVLCLPPSYFLNEYYYLCALLYSAIVANRGKKLLSSWDGIRQQQQFRWFGGCMCLTFWDPYYKLSHWDLFFQSKLSILLTTWHRNLKQNVSYWSLILVFFRCLSTGVLSLAQSMLGSSATAVVRSKITS